MTAALPAIQGDILSNDATTQTAKVGDTVSSWPPPSRRAPAARVIPAIRARSARAPSCRRRRQVTPEDQLKGDTIAASDLGADAKAQVAGRTPAMKEMARPAKVSRTTPTRTTPGKRRRDRGAPRPSVVTCLPLRRRDHDQAQMIRMATHKNARRHRTALFRPGPAACDAAGIIRLAAVIMIRQNLTTSVRMIRASGSATGRF